MNKILSLIGMGDRRFAGSTELYLCVDTPLEIFYVAVGRSKLDGEPVGYLKFVAVGREKLSSGCLAHIFELQEVLPASCPVPSPVISLSGVLWTRQEAVSAHRQISAYQAGSLKTT